MIHKMDKRKTYLIQSLNLQPHPEGGWFAETYRSELTLQLNSGAVRNMSTGIYFLLGSGDISRFHRIKSDEMWHHYEGSAIQIHIIHEDGLYECKRLGKSFEHGESPQLVVPSGCWFGATVDEANSFALVGCTVSPGFDFEDFELADRYQMLQAFPEHESIVRELT